MIADNQAIIYRNIQQFEPSTVYGCAFTRGRSIKLGLYYTEGSCSPEYCSDVDQETLAGSLVAYGYSLFNGGNETFLIFVRDLRDGHVLHKAPTGTPRPQNASRVVGAGSAVAIVLKTDGSVAWINKHPLSSPSKGTEYQVHALDKIGNRLLATGADIDPHSLALAGSTLYWTQAGKPFSTRLD